MSELAAWSGDTSNMQFPASALFRAPETILLKAAMKHVVVGLLLWPKQDLFM